MKYRLTSAAFLSRLGLWLFLDDAIKNDNWLHLQAPEACLREGCSVCGTRHQQVERSLGRQGWEQVLCTPDWTGF